MSITDTVASQDSQKLAQKATRAGKVVAAVSLLTLLGCSKYETAYDNGNVAIEVTPDGTEGRLTQTEYSWPWHWLAGADKVWEFDIEGKIDSVAQLSSQQLRLKRHNSDGGFWSLERSYHNPHNVVHKGYLDAQQAVLSAEFTSYKQRMLEQMSR